MATNSVGTPEVRWNGAGTQQPRSRRRVATVVLGTLCAITAFRGVAASPEPSLATLAALQRTGARVSFLAVDLGHPRVVAALDPSQRLVPASLTKLYTAAYALERWGAEKTFTTAFTSRGTIRDGRLQGDLVFQGIGDPSLTNAGLWSLAAGVRQRGIQEVDGDLIINAAGFAPVNCTAADRCHALRTSHNAYNAPLSAAGVDYATVSVAVIPAAHPGEPARLALEPFAIPMIRLVGAVQTGPANVAAAVRVTRRTEGDTDVVTVSGRVPANGPVVRVYRSVSDPDRQAGQLLRAFLQQAGVRITGTIRTESRPPAPQNQRVAAVEGEPLGIELRKMLTYSNNYMADTLALDLAAAQIPRRQVDLRDAGRLLEQYAGAINARGPFRAVGGADAHPVFWSGSGLTVRNALSARDLVALLNHMYLRAGDFPAFLGALTVPAHTPVPMLAQGAPVWRTRIAVKTGSLSEPVSVFGVAGYFRSPHGGWGAFAAIINGSARRPNIPLDTSLAAVRSAVEAVISTPLPRGSRAAH